MGKEEFQSVHMLPYRAVAQWTLGHLVPSAPGTAFPARVLTGVRLITKAVAVYREDMVYLLERKFDTVFPILQ